MCGAFADADMSFLERLMSGQSLFPWSLAFFLLFLGSVQSLATVRFVYKPAMMANFKLRMQSRCSLVYQTFLTDHDRLYTSVMEIAWNTQMSTNDQRSMIDFAGNQRRDFHTFCYSDRLFKKKKYACQFVLPRFSIFISARILVSMTNSRLW